MKVSPIPNSASVEYGVRVFRGAVYFDRDEGTRSYVWDSYFEPTFPKIGYDSEGTHFLGFSAGKIVYVGGTAKWLFVGIPFWFPALLSLTGLLLSWKWTRRRALRGFPVEPANLPTSPSQNTVPL